jgi:hypothetical protein
MRRLLVAACVAVPGVLWALPSTAAPAPHDAFYDVPGNVASYRPGQVIASRAVEAKSYELGLPVTAWQLKYRTEDFRGRPTATLTTVLVPKAAWRGPGPRPLVSYQTAEDGVDQHCAPSRALRNGIADGFTGSYSETGIVSLALRQGWVVAVPDYEGPRSEFLVAGTEAKGVLDGLRAARAFAPAGVSRSPLGVWGYSGGSFASVTAAQLQPRYAPDLKLTALALGGLLGDVRATINAFSGSVAGGGIPMGINGFARAYPELDLGQYLNADGRAKVAETAGDCLFESVPRYPFLTVEQIEARPHALDSPKVAAMLAANSPLHFSGTPHVATYWYHTTRDEFAPFGPALATVRRFCKAGTPVQADLTPVGEHLTEIGLGVPGAIDFLKARFSGVPPVSSCATLP